MRALARYLVLAAALFVVWAGGAFGAETARLVVSGSSTALGGRGSTTIDLEAGGVSGFVLYVPPGYAASLADPPGAVLGEASGTFEVGGVPVELDGLVTAGDPAAAACGSGSHAAVWLVELGDLTLPLAVDVAGGPEAAFASYRIAACPGSPLVLHDLTLELREVFRNPGSTGAYVWRAVTTPAGGTPVESRSIVRLPVLLELHGALRAGGAKAVLDGSLTAGGVAVADQVVRLLAGPRAAALEPRGRATTGASGRFRLVRPIAQTTLFRATASTPARDVSTSACDAPIAPGGCVDATTGPFEASSTLVRVAVPKLPTLRLGSRGPRVRQLQGALVELRYLPPGSVNGLFGERTWHAVVAFQGWEGLPRDGVVAARTWRKLDRAHAPRAWGGLERGVQIDRSRQVLLMVNGGRLVRALHVSTAAPGHVTPAGHFSVYRKEVLSWSIPFQAWMPYANYFYGGFAVHGYSSVPPYPASHGCVRVPMIEAPILYAFATYGTPVWIR